MTAEQWKRGDVAMVECSDGNWRRAFCVEYVGHGELEWEFQDGRLRRVRASTARPLAVIDPEDMDAAPRLWELYVDADKGYTTPTQDLQAALRQFANPTPPKPKAPTGWGAVVEDSDGWYWTLIAPDSNAWANYGHHGYRVYGEIDAVRIVSPGVEGRVEA
jgi:hypothetical protein